MKKIIIFISLLFTALFVTNLFAQNEQAAKSGVVNITIVDAVQRVLEHNLGLKVQEYTLEKARISKNASWFPIVPQASLSSNYRRSNREPSATPANPNPSRVSLSANLQITSRLVDLLTKNIADIFSSIRNYEGQKISFETVVLNTAVQTQKAYFDLFIAREQLDLLKDKRDLQVEAFSESEDAYNNGLRDEFTFLKTKLAYLGAQRTYDVQKKTESDFTRAFALLMGYDISTKIVLTDKIPVLSDEDINTFLASVSMEDNTSVAAQTQFLRALRASRAGAYFSYFPTVSFTWGLGTNFLQDPEVADWFNDNNWGEDNGNWNVTIAFNVNNLFPWSQQSVVIRHLNKDIKAKKAEIQKLLEDNENTKESLSQQLLLSIETLKTNQIEVETALRAYSLAKEAYNNGLMPITDYLSSENDLRDAQVKHIVQQAEASKIILDIKALTNQKQGLLNP